VGSYSVILALARSTFTLNFAKIAKDRGCCPAIKPSSIPLPMLGSNSSEQSPVGTCSTSRVHWWDADAT